MTVICPNGHASAATDYCDQCGAKIPPPAAAAPSPPIAAAASPPAEAVEIPPDSVSIVTSTAAVAAPCPDCGAPRAGTDRYCEACGYDFVDGESAQPAAVIAAPPPWTAQVLADREYFERLAPEGVTFPGPQPPRSFLLDKYEVRIGRGGPSSDAKYEVELAAPAEDPAVSRLHAVLARQEDGSYAVVDEGSSNGTTVNDDPTPITPHVPVPLKDGDHVHVGAWTTITLRCDAAGESPQPGREPG
jgi:hypothetical protein